MSRATATRTRGRVPASPLTIVLGGLGAAAVLLAAVAVFAGSSDRGAAAAGGAGGQLAWSAPPRVYVAPGMPRDRILNGTVRNDSVRVAEVEAGDIAVLDADGERLKSAGVFLGSFARGLYAGPRKDRASDIERRRTGRLLRIGPGGEQPLTVSWRTGPDGVAARRIEYGTGSLTVP